MNVLIEAEAGSREKRSYDEESMVYRKSGETLLPYPYPYGFIIGTRSPEGDALDSYIITSRHLVAGTIVSSIPIALLEFFEEEERDHKVLAALPEEEAERFIERWRA